MQYMQGGRQCYEHSSKSMVSRVAGLADGWVHVVVGLLCGQVARLSWGLGVSETRRGDRRVGSGCDGAQLMYCCAECAISGGAILIGRGFGGGEGSVLGIGSSSRRLHLP